MYPRRTNRQLFLLLSGSWATTHATTDKVYLAKFPRKISSEELASQFCQNSRYPSSSFSSGRIHPAAAPVPVWFTSHIVLLSLSTSGYNMFEDLITFLYDETSIYLHERTRKLSTPATQSGGGCVTLIHPLVLVGLDGWLAG